MDTDTRPTLESSTGSSPSINHRQRSPMPWVVVSALAVVALLCATLSLAFLSAKTTTVVNVPNAGMTGVSVTTTATIHAVPDMATVYFGVSATESTIASARSVAAGDATKVMNFLLSSGIKTSDITTTSISLYQQSPGTYAVPDYCVPIAVPQGTSSGTSHFPGVSPIPTPSGTPQTIGSPAPVDVPGTGSSESSTSPTSLMPPCICESPSMGVGAPGVATTGPVAPSIVVSPCGYNYTMWTYSENLVVVIRNLDQASNVIDGAIAHGANSVSGPSFDVSNRTALEAQARTQAISQAHDQALSMTTAAGASLGKPVSISASFNGPYYDKSFAAPAAQGGTTTPVSPGTLDITATVTVVFAIE